MGLPAEPDLEFLARAVLAQIVQDRTAATMAGFNRPGPKPKSDRRKRGLAFA